MRAKRCCSAAHPCSYDIWHSVAEGPVATFTILTSDASPRLAWLVRLLPQNAGAAAGGWSLCCAELPGAAAGTMLAQPADAASPASAAPPPAQHNRMPLILGDLASQELWLDTGSPAP